MLLVEEPYFTGYSKWEVYSGFSFFDGSSHTDWSLSAVHSKQVKQSRAASVKLPLPGQKLPTIWVTRPQLRVYPFDPLPNQLYLYSLSFPYQ